MDNCGDYTQCCRCLVAKACQTLPDPTDCSTPGCPVPHHLPEFAQVHVHWISDTIHNAHIYILKRQPVLFKQFLSVSYTLVKLERQLKGIAILTTLFSMQIWGRLIDLFMYFALRFLKQKCCMILRQRFLTIFYAMGPFRSLVKPVDSFSK